MPSFLFSAFAIAGTVAALGPVIIHLLNRRRFRVVNWAAMDFLREAVQRNRRILQIRDIILLVLRTAVILLLGLALARPFFARTGATASPNEPLHAVLLLDNSLSMGYVQADGSSLLDETKKRAAEYINELPTRSVISVLPLATADGDYSLHETKTDALAAIERITTVDRRISAGEAIRRARDACLQTPTVPSKRIVLLSDQQQANWNKGQSLDDLKGLADLQVVDVSARDAENTWVADLRLVDGIADSETATQFVATIGHQGPTRNDVQVTLSINGEKVKSKTINVENGQLAEVTFEHRFDNPPEPGQTLFEIASVSLPSDRLEADNSRSIAAPVVAALPVVFVDDLGDEASKTNIGDTHSIIRMLAPQTVRGEPTRQLVQAKRAKIDQLDRELLRDARLVIISGIESPGSAAPLLREYVEQGGQLLIAAGGQFNPTAWNEAAWRDGAGILPTRLKTQLVGKLPEESPMDVRIFLLDYPSMTDNLFRLPENSDQQMAEVYDAAIFFKAVDLDATDKDFDDTIAAEEKRIAARQQSLAEISERERARRKLSDAEQREASVVQEAAKDEAQRVALDPSWVLWTADQVKTQASLPVDEQAAQTRPRIVARFNNAVPAFVQRQIGRGQVMFFSSSIKPTWNDLAKKDAAFLLDRIPREMLERTIERRNFSTAETIVLPINPIDRSAKIHLQRPDGTEENFKPESLNENDYGVLIRNPRQRGQYLVTARRAEAKADDDTSRAEIWKRTLAVNGDPQESDLQSFNEVTLAEYLGDNTAAGAEPAFRWIARAEPIRLEGALISGMNLWRWVAQLVLLCLLAELVVLAWPLAFPRLAVVIAMAVALLWLTSGTPVGTIETIAHYLVITLGVLTVAMLLALSMLRPEELETA